MNSCFTINEKELNCVHGYHLKTINCPYSQKLGLMCCMSHIDTNHQFWCTHALVKNGNGNGYKYCPSKLCPYTLMTNLKCSMHHHDS